MIVLQHLTKHFRGVQALDDLSLRIDEGGIVGIIGRNGAGKTTLFNLIAGRFPPTAGDIHFRGRDITRLGAFERAALGIGRTFQIPAPLMKLTVFENVLAGAFARHRRRSEASERADATLQLCGLSRKAGLSSGELTVPDLRRLEIARALAAEPHVLLLDEVMAGLRMSEVDEAMTLCREINASGVTLVVVEHVMYAVMNLCQRVIVVDQGRVIADGLPAAIQRDRNVIDIYLGRSRDA